MHVTVLGPVVAYDGDRELDLGGPMSRALVARLALAVGRPVPATTLIDDLWDADVPADTTNALQSIVSRARRRLPDGALVSTTGGYVLAATVDADEFRRLVGAGRAADGLALWRGDALADLREFPFARRLAPGLDEARLAALEQDLDARRPDPALAAELAELAAAHPYRDRLWLLYLRTLVACGRPSEALRAYETLRTRLAEDLGADPAPEVQALHGRILQGGSGAAQRSRHPLPAPLTSFVGRGDAVEDLHRALAVHRLVTVVGPGGAGKTRLAVETARSADRAGAGDVWLVELAPVTGPDDVVPAVLAGMGLLEVSVLERRAPASPAADPRQRLSEAVGDLDGLLVLDNCEHVVDAAAEVVEQLLARGPRVRVLATSREALQLTGEHVYPLGPLGLPPADVGVQEALRFSAVRLFTERAVAADRTFTLDATTLPAVREICERLDGQPLAIELAAARLRTLGVGEVAARLSDRFRLLTGGNRTLPRHRTLRAVVEWSWDLLRERERDLAERVAVFPGGVTVAGAAAVFDDAVDVPELLESLAEKSLLVPERAAGRFRMLETLREYGAERLVERDVAEKVRSAHLDHFLAVAEDLARRTGGPDQVAAIRTTDTERGNLTAALRFAIDRGDRHRAARLIRSLTFYWAVRNEHAEMNALVRAVVEIPGSTDPGLEITLAGLAAAGSFTLHEERHGWRAQVDRILDLWDAHHPDDGLTILVMSALQHFGVAGDRRVPESADLWQRSVIRMLRLAMMENSGETEGVGELLAQTVAGFRACGDSWGLAAALSLRGMLAASDGDLDAAAASLREALPLLEGLGAEQDVAIVRLRLMNLKILTAGPAELDRLHDDLLDQLRTAQQPGGRSAALLRLGLSQVCLRRGRTTASVRHLQDLLANLNSHDPLWGEEFLALVHAGLSIAATGDGDLPLARASLGTAARTVVQMRVHDMPVAAGVLVARAVLVQAEGDDEEAARLLGTADAVRGRVDRSNTSAEELAQRLRELLGEARFARLHQDGTAIELRDALVPSAGEP